MCDESEGAHVDEVVLLVMGVTVTVYHDATTDQRVASLRLAQLFSACRRSRTLRLLTGLKINNISYACLTASNLVSIYHLYERDEFVRWRPS